VLLRLVHEGLVDGLRVDHPDGLADPRGYLTRLSAKTGGAWIVVEKILAHGEELPDWPCAGTTGYDALSLVGGLFIDPAGDVTLTDEYVRFTGGKQDFAEIERDAKHDIANGTFAAELARLPRLFDRPDRPDPRPGAAQARAGHGVRPLVPAGRAERGRRRPRPLRRQPGRVPRHRRAAGPALAGHHDHAVHPRHQAAGRRHGPAGGAGRMAAGLGSPGGRVARPDPVARRRGRGRGHRARPRARSGI